MRKLTQKKIDIIIENHKHWLKRDCEGWEQMRAYFVDTNFGGADLGGVDLSYANFVGANFVGADLGGANLNNANFYDANFNGANLRDANLSYADLSGASLRCANLCGANLSYAALSYANLAAANLRDANLDGAYLCDTNLGDADLYGAINIPFIPMVCPTHGSFIGYKKAYPAYPRLKDSRETNVIIKLEICEDARRSSGIGRKCRCDKAKVISISSLDGSKTFHTAHSMHNSSFIYKVGEIVEEPNFCEDRFRECAEGIHFFIDKQEAIDYI